MGKPVNWVSTIVLAVLVLGTNLVFLSEAFSITNWWNSHVVEDPKQIYFSLYPNKENLSYYENLVPGDLASLQASSYNASRPIILLIHGFVSNRQGEFAQILTQAYLETNTEANVVFVDWSELAFPNASVPLVFYHLAAANVPLAGKTIAEFLIFLMKEKYLSGPKNIHLVGHSLGAHASGITGQNFLNLTDSLVGRITGLDPAGPEFLYEENDDRLDSTDAHFVDIIHTDQGQNGYQGDLGHADFYPNGGGPSQPNCSYSSILTGVCAHSTAYKYYAESIRNPNIIACACDEYFPSADCLTPCLDPVIFGEHCTPRARGDYYLNIYL